MGANVKAEAEALLAPLEAEGIEVWHVEYLRERGMCELRVFVDKDGGIGIDDCERVSRYLSERLDAADLIDEAYSLVVSSPGMDRQLFTDAQYARYVGQPVEVSLYKAVDGRKKFAALLGGRDGGALRLTPIDRVTLAPECGETAVPLELVGKVNLMVVF